MPKLLSPDAVQRFETDGYIAGIPVLTPEEVTRYRAHLEGFRERHPEHWVKLKSKANVLCPWVDEMARLPRVLDAFEDLVGPDILCWTMAFRVKDADKRTFAGWHQDTAYNRIEPVLVIGALALSECSKDHGCLSVIPGSHKGPVMPHGETGSSDSILVRGQYISSEFDKSNAVDLTLRPGEMALFNSHIIHGSLQNITDDPRLMVLVEMMPTQARSTKTYSQTAMLVRGEDRYRHFGADPRPDGELSPTALAAWQRVMDARGKALFDGSKLQTYGAYTGVATSGPSAAQR